MARTRYINPKALHDEDVVCMSLVARYVWAYLPCFADKEGRLVDKPLSLKIDMLPNDTVDMNSILDEIAQQKHIIRYEVAGKKYIQIRTFSTYQKPYANEIPSKIPHVGFVLQGPTLAIPEKEFEESKKTIVNSNCIQETGDRRIVNSNEVTKFNINSFSLLFGEWPSQDNPIYNEPISRAQSAFYENINAENFEAFEKAWNTQLDLYKKDKSKDRRRKLGTFRTFCEGRWMNVEQIQTYEQKPHKSGRVILENFVIPPSDE